MDKNTANTKEKEKSYKVIARKYRPSTFSEVIGQEHITKTIAKSIAQKKIAHAYLFSGPHGVGKTSLARIIAKSLNCINGPTDAPCGVCSSCIQIANGTPLDVIEIDGASNRGIENIRTIIENVRISPVSGKYKIYIIDEVHQITNEAFNALLKTLEEPPPHVVFILATTEAERVLPTIRSRCQQYTFKLLTIEDIEKILKHILSKEEVQYDDEAIFLIARNARGSVRDAETILEKMIAFTIDKRSITRDDVLAVIGENNFTYVKSFFDIMIKGEKKEYFLFIKNMFENAIEPRAFISSLIEYMRIVLMMKSGIEDTKILEIAEQERLELIAFVNNYKDDEIERILDYILSVEERIRNASNAKVIFEMRMMMLLDINNILRPVDIISEVAVSNEIIKEKNIDCSNTKKAEKNNTPSSDTEIPLDPNDKRHIFYKKVLSFIETESPTVYSLLSQGSPISSDGPILNVSVPESIFEAINNDKRIKDIVAKAISNFTHNKSVAIKFQKELNGDVIEKLKTALNATEIEPNS